MNKILFFQEKEKRAFIATINNELKIKNRLLGLILSNPDRKTNALESSRKAFKYEQQIMLLHNMQKLAGNVRSREDIGKLNKMIEAFQSLDG